MKNMIDAYLTRLLVMNFWIGMIFGKLFPVVLCPNTWGVALLTFDNEVSTFPFFKFQKMLLYMRGVGILLMRVGLKLLLDVQCVYCYYIKISEVNPKSLEKCGNNLRFQNIPPMFEQDNWFTSKVLVLITQLLIPMVTCSHLLKHLLSWNILMLSIMLHILL